MRLVALTSFVTVTILGFLSAPALAQQSATVTQAAPIYGEALVSATPLRTAAVGTKLRVVQDAGEWLQVDFNDPQLGLRRGWVKHTSVRVADPTTQPMDLSLAPAPSAQISRSSRCQGSRCSSRTP